MEIKTAYQTDKDSKATLSDIFGEKLQAFKDKLEGRQPAKTLEQQEREEQQKLEINVQELSEYAIKNLEVLRQSTDDVFLAAEMYYSLSGSMSYDRFNVVVGASPFYKVMRFPTLVIESNKASEYSSHRGHILYDVFKDNPYLSKFDKEYLMHGSQLPKYGDFNWLFDSPYTPIRCSGENYKIQTSIKDKETKKSYIVIPFVPAEFYDFFWEESELWDIIKK